MLIKTCTHTTHTLNTLTITPIMLEATYTATMDEAISAFHHMNCDDNEIIACCFKASTKQGMFDQTCPIVEVRESPIHGRGVFATKPIQKGEIVTTYPAHCIATVKGREIEAQILSGEPEHHENILHHHPTYSMFIHKNTSNAFNASKSSSSEVFLMGNPSIPSYHFSCAHLINDPYPDTTKIDSIRAIRRTGTPELITKLYIDYTLRTQRAKNTKLVGKHYYAYATATRDIAQGEEILAPYGFMYWADLTEKELVTAVKEYRDTLESMAQRDYITSFWNTHSGLQGH